MASRAGSTEKVQMLVDAGASVSAVNSQGNTPLHLAAINGHEATCKVLVTELGADPTVRNKEGSTCVDVAKNPATKAALGHV